jgi:hypothetical protein
MLAHLDRKWLLRQFGNIINDTDRTNRTVARASRLVGCVPGGTPKGLIYTTHLIPLP